MTPHSQTPEQDPETRPELDWEDLRWVSANTGATTHVRRAWETDGGVCAPAPVLSVAVSGPVGVDLSRAIADALREHRQDPDRWVLRGSLTAAECWPFPFLRVYVNGPGAILRTSASPRWTVRVHRAGFSWLGEHVLRPLTVAERLGRALAARPQAELDALCGVYDLGGVLAVQEVLRSIYDQWADRDSNVIARRA